MIGLSGLTVGYGKLLLIEDVNACFAPSSLVALIGRNGAGKSSLLRVIAGLDKPLAGEVDMDGKPLATMTAKEKARTIALVTTSRIRVQSLRCRDLVAMGRAPFTGWAGSLAKDDWEKVDESIAMVGMQAYANRSMDTMSDGECQRIMIARALAQDTPVMLLDEPTSFLDLPNRYELCLLLKSIAKSEGKCIMLSTHELDIALDIADVVALIDSPRLVTGCPQEIVNSESLQRLFQNASVAFDPSSGKVRPKH